MNSPKLKFSFDSKVEHKIAWNFYNDQTFGGVNFWEKGALQYHPDLISLEKVKNKKSFLADYIFSLYQKHNSEFNSQKKEIVNSLERIDKKIDWLLSFCKDCCTHNISKEI